MTWDTHFFLNGNMLLGECLTLFVVHLTSQYLFVFFAFSKNQLKGFFVTFE